MGVSEIEEDLLVRVGFVFHQIVDGFPWGGKTGDEGRASAILPHHSSRKKLKGRDRRKEEGGGGRGGIELTLDGYRAGRTLGLMKSQKTKRKIGVALGLGIQGEGIGHASWGWKRKGRR
jgi:hypothetical protein